LYSTVPELSWGNEKNHKNMSGQLVSHPRWKPEVSKIQIRSVISMWVVKKRLMCWKRGRKAVLYIISSVLKEDGTCPISILCLSVGHLTRHDLQNLCDLSTGHKDCRHIPLPSFLPACPVASLL
jgi:hypothetical protein